MRPASSPPCVPVIMDAFDAATEQDAFDALEQYARTCLQRFDDAPDDTVARVLGGGVAHRWRGRLAATEGDLARLTVQRRGPALPAALRRRRRRDAGRFSPRKGDARGVRARRRQKSTNRGGRRGLARPSPAARAETHLRIARSSPPRPAASRRSHTNSAAAAALETAWPPPRRPARLISRDQPGLRLLPSSMAHLSLPSTRVNCRSHAFLLELTEIAHGRDAPFGLFRRGRGGARMTALKNASSALSMGNCYLLTSILVVFNGHLLLFSSSSRRRRTVWALKHGAGSLSCSPSAAPASAGSPPAPRLAAAMALNLGLPPLRAARRIELSLSSIGSRRLREDIFPAHGQGREGPQGPHLLARP